MDYSSVFAEGGNEVSQEKPPRRVCPRCNSTNTKFCYYNNHSVSQQRYRCKDCRRKWTHGGALRNIPIGGSGRKNKSRRIDQPSASQVVSAAVQQVSRRRQPFSHAQETNQFVGIFGGSSSSSGIDFGNQIGSFPDTHGDVVLPFQSFPPTDRSYFHDGLFQQDYYNVQSNDMIGNHLNNQSIGNHLNNQSIGNHLNNQSIGNHLINQSTGNHLNNQSIGNHLMNQSIGSYNVVHSDQNSYINKEDQNKWNHQNLNNTMNMNHNASTSGSRLSWDTDHMYKNNGNIKNNCVYKSYYHLENHGP